MIPVDVYSTPNCVQCMMTKKQMTKLGIKFNEHDLSQMPKKVEEFKALGYVAAPIVTTDTKIWSGFRLEKINSLYNFLFHELGKKVG